MNDQGKSVTIAVTNHVALATSEAYEVQVKDLHRSLQDCPGFLSVDTVRHVRTHQMEYTILLRFADETSAHQWKERPEIATKLAAINELTGGPTRIVESAGLGLWVDHIPGAEPALPPYWKRVVLSVLGVYPMLMVLLAVLNPMTASLPRPLQVLCVVIVLACLLTWPIMPTLGKWLRPWLTAKTT